MPFLPIPGPLRFQRNLRGRPFFRFQRNRKERQDVFPSAPQGQRKKTRVFLRAIYGSEETLLCRRKSLAIFDGRGRVPRKFIEFSGDNEKKDESYFYRPIHGSVKIASMRRARSKIGLPSSIFLSSNRKERPSPQIPLESEGTRNRRGPGIRDSGEKSYGKKGPGVGKNIDLSFLESEGTRWGPYCMQFLWETTVPLVQGKQDYSKKVARKKDIYLLF